MPRMISAERKLRLEQTSWEHFAERHGILEAAIEPVVGRDYQDCLGEPTFKPRIECLQIPNTASHAEMVIEILDRIIATSYDPGNPWHRYAWAALRYFRYQQHESLRPSSKRRQNNFSFDYLQNEDGSSTISTNTNGPAAAVVVDSPIPVKEIA